MSTRRSNDEYPEHLNPFKKSGGIRGSFREIKRTLSIKFRRKDPKKSSNDSRAHSTVARNSVQHIDSHVTLREYEGGTIQHHKSEIYPRSRFHERANRAQTLAPTSQPGDNPFGDEENNNEEKCKKTCNESSQIQQPEAVDGQRTVRKKRRKKRAPLPPGLSGVSASGLNQSQWSLSSYETDCSSAAYYSETTQDENEPDIKGSYRGLNDIHEISNEIISYFNSKCTDNNEKVAADNDNDKSEEAIKQVVNAETSCDQQAQQHDVESRGDQKDVESRGDQEAVESRGHEKAVESTGDQEVVESRGDQKAVESTGDQEVVESRGDQEVVESSGDQKAVESRGDQKPVESKGYQEAVESSCVVKTQDVVETSCVIKAQDVVESSCAEEACEPNCNLKEVTNRNGIQTEKTELAVDNEEERAIDEVTSNLNETVLNAKNKDDSKYVETKLLYITGSCDDLDVCEPVLYKQKVSMKIAGSCDALETIDAPKSNKSGLNES